MIESLQQTVPTITKTAIHVFCLNSPTEQKCLMSLLSALWNLASHCIQNKQAMCEKEFLRMLVELLSDNPKYILLVETASGILKYLCGKFNVFFYYLHILLNNIVPSSPAF